MTDIPEKVLRAAVLGALGDQFNSDPRTAMGVAHDAGWRIGRTIGEDTIGGILDQLVAEGLAKVVDHEALDVDGNPAPRYVITSYSTYHRAMRSARRTLNQYDKAARVGKEVTR